MSAELQSASAAGRTGAAEAARRIHAFATDLKRETVERRDRAVQYARARKDNMTAALAAARTANARRRVETAWRMPHFGRPHRMPGRLLVSLTSYPPRFATLALTLQSLLRQSIEPNAVLLWLAHDDFKGLPDDIKRMSNDTRLQIRLTDDLGPYKKFAPARKLYPAAFIATADDDVFYERTWLETLVRGYRPGRTEIPCGRAHWIELDGAGRAQSYADWRHDIADGPASPRVFPTGVGGMLLPPRSLHPAATDASLFQALCPNADDVWLYWMARRAGWTFRKVGPRRALTYWDGTQDVALCLKNAIRGGGNDQQVARMTAAFGAAWRPDFVMQSLGPHHSLRLQRA